MSGLVYAQSDIIAVLVLILLLWCFRKKSNWYLLDQKLLGWMLIINIIILMLDAATGFLDGLESTALLNMAINSLCYSLNPILGYCYILYCESKLGYEYQQISRHAKWFLIPVFLHFFLVICNLFSPILFVMDATGSYQRGSLFSLSWILSYFLVAVAIIQIVLNYRKDKNANHNIHRALLAYPIPPIIGGLLQYLYPEFAILWVSTMFSMLILFISTQNTKISTDTLTGLYNRSRLYEYLEWKTKKINKKQNLYLIMLDLNHFKSINDSFGHLEGDNALRITAKSLRNVVIRYDFLARYGGDEFIIITERKDLQEVDPILQRIQGQLLCARELYHTPYALSFSAGISCWQEGVSTVDSFIGEADQRMYRDKVGMDKVIKPF